VSTCTLVLLYICPKYTVLFVTRSRVLCALCAIKTHAAYCLCAMQRYETRTQRYQNEVPYYLRTPLQIVFFSPFLHTYCSCKSSRMALPIEALCSPRAGLHDTASNKHKKAKSQRRVRLRRSARRIHLIEQNRTANQCFLRGTWTQLRHVLGSCTPRACTASETFLQVSDASMSSVR
jgi:hypothetical protein